MAKNWLKILVVVAAWGLAASVLIFYMRVKEEEERARAYDDWFHNVTQHVENGDVAKVKRLLVTNPELANVDDGYGRLMLQYAAQLGSKEIVEQLLANGADVNVTSTVYGYKKLHYRDASGRLRRPEGILTNEPTACSFLTTPLGLAVRNGHKDVVELLLTKADVNLKDEYGCTALDYALKHNRTEIVGLLRARGAKCGKDVGEPNAARAK